MRKRFVLRDDEESAILAETNTTGDEKVLLEKDGKATKPALSRIRRRLLYYAALLSVITAIARFTSWLSKLDTLVVISYAPKELRVHSDAMVGGEELVRKEGDKLRLWNSLLHRSSSSANYSWFGEPSRRHASPTMSTPSEPAVLRGSKTTSASVHHEDHHTSVLIMITSDAHGHVRRACRDVCYPGAASIASAIRTVRQSATKQPVLLIDAGDALFGAGDGVNEKIVGDVMNLLGYDATALGNHDFDIGARRLEDFAERVDFPILASNVDGLHGVVQKHLRVNLGRDIFLCLVGVTTAEENPLMGADVTIRPEVESTLAYSSQLKQDGLCHHIVVVSHAGIVVDQEIARHTSIVDAIVGGHSHVMTGVPADAMPESAEFGRVLSTNLPFPFHPNGTDAPIAHVGSYGRYMGLLQLDWIGSDLAKVEGSLVPLDVHHGVYPDPVVDEWLNERMALENNESSSKAIERPIRFQFDSTIGKNDACGFVCRKDECLLGNFATDAMRSCVLNGHCPAPTESLPVVALLESGTLRDCVSTAGDEDFASILPWPNTLVLLTVTGNILRDMLEHGVKSREENGGAFLQVSGMNYRYQYKEQAIVTNVSVSTVIRQNAPSARQQQHHDRVVIMSTSKAIHGSASMSVLSSESLQDEPLYLLVVTDWFAAGGDGYGPYVTEAKSKVKTNITLQDMILQHSKMWPNVQREGRSCLIMQPLLASSASFLFGTQSSHVIYVVLFSSLLPIF